MIKNYKFWYGLITVGILLVLFYGYTDFTSCIADHSSGKFSGPYFCGVATFLVFVPIISFWLSMTSLLVVRESYRKKGVIKFSGYKFWLYSVVLSVVLVVLFGVITTSSGGLMNMLNR